MLMHSNYHILRMFLPLQCHSGLRSKYKIKMKNRSRAQVTRDDVLNEHVYPYCFVGKPCYNGKLHAF
jgi:hypothetical protein